MLVQEAIDGFLAGRRADELESVLSLHGALSADEADELERRIAEAGSTWTASSSSTQTS